ncbi:FkbM family methyltransferase [bacterium]|nr:FkbM family methyltransferase [bacterium]
MLKALIIFWNEGLTYAQMFLARRFSGAKNLRMIDIGASGLVKPKISMAFETSELTACDPDPRAASDFQDLNFKVKFLPCAVAGVDGPQTLYLTKKSHCSSLMKPVKIDDIRYKIDREIIVDCRTLDSLGVSADIIKIDVQGAELEILRHAKYTLLEACAVELEVCFESLYRDQAEFSKLHEFMLSHGFAFAGFSSLYFGDTAPGSSISFGDALFVRPPQTIDEYKVTLVSLIDASLERLITHFQPKIRLVVKDRVILLAIRTIGAFKTSAPKLH